MNIFEIFNDILSIAKALTEVKSTLHKTHDVEKALQELEEKTLAPLQDLCKKISQLLHLHIGQGEQKMLELEGALNIKGAKEMLAKHEELMAQEGK